MTTTETRSIPTPAEARVHPLADAVCKAARAAKRDDRPYYVVATYTGYRIARSEDEVKFNGRHFKVYADHAEVVAA